ncbi:MAG: molecular chaperone TorD family protein [Betaproteobacteria bacterium]|nr:molecular chaperone TorD family protein [Betaproteobacteria bacterium]
MANDIDRSRTLKLLGSMYLCRPSREAVSAWTSLLDDGGSGFLKDIKYALEGIDTASAGVLEDLLWDYTRLFIGPYRLPCPPWESVYTSQNKLMMQDAADEARRYYADFGLTIDDPAVMPDHIGAELSFLSLVYERSGEANGKRSDCVRIGEAFVHDHLLRWVPQFTADMERAAETELYKTLAGTTRNALELFGGK